LGKKRFKMTVVSQLSVGVYSPASRHVGGLWKAFAIGPFQ